MIYYARTEMRQEFIQKDLLPRVSLLNLCIADNWDLTQFKTSASPTYCHVTLEAIEKNIKSHIMTKPTKWHVRPTKTQISLGIRPVWSESLLSAWRNIGSLATHWEHSEDSDQTGQMPMLI